MFTTFESYLEGERTSQHRHELVAGRVYALAGGSERHDLFTPYGNIEVDALYDAVDRSATTS